MQTKAIRRVAAIDIGTNSVRLARGVMNDGRFCMEQKDLETTRIGEGTTTTDRLSDEPMRRTADAVAFFARQAADSGYALLGAYATSAVREAPNKDEFLALCRARGVEVEVLSGHAESAVAYYGAAQGKAGVCAVADIGGGSTELSFGRDGRLEFGQSARVGAVRMREMFAKDDGSLDDAAYDALLAHVKSVLLPIAEKIPKGAALIGVGGTFTSLAAMQQRLTVYDPARVQELFAARGRHRIVQPYALPHVDGTAPRAAGAQEKARRHHALRGGDRTGGDGDSGCRRDLCQRARWPGGLCAGKSDRHFRTFNRLKRKNKNTKGP